MRAGARFAGILAALTAAYVLAGLVGLSFAAVHPAATAIWPPAGLAVAALLVLGLRAWPAATAGAFITNLIALEHAGVAAAIAAGDTIAHVVAAALTIRIARGRRAFERGADIVRFAFVAAMVSSVISASIGTAALRWWAFAPAGDAWAIWITWWLGDATSVAIYTPLLVLLVSPQPPPRAGRHEGVLLAGAVALVLYVSFGAPADLQRDVPLGFLLLPLMIWAAFRVDARTTSAIGVAMVIVAIHRTLRDLGPFELGEPAESLLVVQSITAIITLLMLAVAAEIGVRRSAEREMRLLNASLEERIRERTAELTRVHDRLVEAQAVAHIGSWEWDIPASAFWWSEELCRIFGVSVAPSSHDAYLRLIHPDDRERTGAEVQRAIRTGEPFAFEHRIVRSDGSERVLHARCSVEFDDTGVPRRLLGTAHDITERVRAEDARAQLILEQAKLREAEEANRAKDAFLAILSHELRTPLNAALGWTHILRESLRAGTRNDRALEIIYRNLLLQARIVSDIVDISRITRGDLPMDRDRVDLRRVFEAALDMVREEASARDVSIEIGGASSLTVLGDGRRLEQVAWNLLSNAVKFARPHGKVTVSMRESDDDVECSVEDDGPGIAPGFLPHVFEPFRQADSSSTREHSGLGLGLAIAHGIVGMHGGTITAGNRAGGGAVFVVRLPKSGPPERSDTPVPVVRAIT